MAILDTHIANGPVCAELVVKLRNQIAEGLYADGDRIPTEAQLARDYGISVRSVRSGVDELVSEGLLVRRQGSGTYVTNGKPRRQAGSRADTIAMVLPLRLRGYHPFFSEMLRGIREGIDGCGKQVLELNFGSRRDGREDVEPVNWTRDQSMSELNACRGLAGIICGASVAQELQDGLQQSIPVVAVDPTEAVPFVAYDWFAELDQAVLRQVAAGARYIWVYGSSDDWQPPLVPPHVTVRRSPGTQQDRGLLSAHILHAYEEAKQVFGAWQQLDGVIVGSDFEAQGVLDAATKCRVQAPEKVRFTCIVNRESRLTYPFPLTVQVADGYEKGKRVVKLLRQFTISPSTCARRVILRCDEESHGH